MFILSTQTDKGNQSFIIMHTKILAQIYFLFGYATSITMFCNPELYLKMLGVFLASYLTYLIASQIEQTND